MALTDYGGRLSEPTHSEPKSEVTETWEGNSFSHLAGRSRVRTCSWPETAKQHHLQRRDPSISVSKCKFQSKCSLLCMDRLVSCMLGYCSWPLFVTPVSFLLGSLVSQAGWYDAASLKLYKPYSIRWPLPVVHLGFGTRVPWDLKESEMYLLTLLLRVITDLIFIGLWQNLTITVEVLSLNVLTWYF